MSMRLRLRLCRQVLQLDFRTTKESDEQRSGTTTQPFRVCLPTVLGRHNRKCLAWVEVEAEVQRGSELRASTQTRAGANRKTRTPQEATSLARVTLERGFCDAFCWET